MEYKFDGTIQVAAQEIAEEIRTKLERNTQAAIGFYLHDDGTATVDRGFSCYDDTPDVILFAEHCGEEVLGEVPAVAEWDDETIEAIAKGYEYWIRDELISQDISIVFDK